MQSEDFLEPETTKEVATLFTPQHRSISDTMAARVQEMLKLPNLEILQYGVSKQWNNANTESIRFQVDEKTVLELNITKSP
jgi:hypothetical protein